MSTETHIENLELNIYVSIIDVDLLLTHEDLVSYGSRLAVAWDDQGISFVASPLFEDLKGEATVQHTWGSKADHWLIGFDVGCLQRLNMLEVEHVFLDESFLYFLVCPVNEESVVEVGSLSQTT